MVVESGNGWELRHLRVLRHSYLLSRLAWVVGPLDLVKPQVEGSAACLNSGRKAGGMTLSVCS